MKFSDKLQKIRKENNITQEGLADRLNVSRQAVSKWESGIAYPDTEKLIQISKIFNVSLDELINDNIDMDKNNDNKNKKMSFMEILNLVLEFISRSVNMFWSMKWTEKIKCLFEIAFLMLVIFIVAMISTSIMVNLVRRIFIFLPSDFVYDICNLFETLLFLVWLVLGFVIVVKIFKSRYLDYYVFVTDDSVSEKTIEEPIKELKEKKEYKVVIRDPKDSSLNIFKKLGRIWILFVKFLCFIFLIPVVIFFILCIMALIFGLFYIMEGLFFDGILIALVGVLLFLYLMIEFIYNLLFNREHVVNRIFIIFILSISLIGVGFGLSFFAISNFTYEDNNVSDVNTHIIDMEDNLIISNMMHDYNMIIIEDNNIDNIKMEITSYNGIDTYLYSYNESNNRDNFKVIDVVSDYNEIDIYKNIFDGLKNEKIIDYNKDFDIKLYVSHDNLTKLRENINNYTGNVWFE